MKTENHIKPSRFIRESRKAMSLTQAQLGSLVGKKRISITCYETERSMPPGDVILKIISMRFPGLCLLQQHSFCTAGQPRNQEACHIEDRENIINGYL